MRKGFLIYREMRKYFHILYMRRPLVIYDFATAPLWISLYTRKIWFSFYQCTVYSLRSGAQSCQHILAVCLPADGRGTRARDTRRKIRYFTVFFTLKLKLSSENFGYLNINLELFKKRSYTLFYRDLEPFLNGAIQLFKRGYWVI